MSLYKEYIKAKASCDKIEEQFNRAKKEKEKSLENFTKNILVLALVEAKKQVTIPPYYLTGGGRVVVQSWEVKKDCIEVCLGCLAEDERWPNNGPMVNIPLSVLE